VERIEPSFGPIRRGNIPAAIATELRAQIEQGRLEAGRQLPGHRELAALFSVSVGSVREALSVLIAEGLVETRAGRGTFVAVRAAVDAVAPRVTPPRERKAIEELIEAREVLELQVAAMAARRASAEQVAELRRHVERLEAAASRPEGFLDADFEFHVVLAEASGNRYLVRAMTEIRSLLKQDMELAAETAIRRFGDLRFSVEEHRRLVEAIAGHDADAAREILAGMMSRSHEFVLGLYALAPAPDGQEVGGQG
jgi:GntR family transcriptional repressor for pyruvate dehydrogenase complex